VSNLLPIGPTIDKTDFRTLFTWTSVARALLMAAIPVLFSAGYLSFGVLVMIVLLNPFFQNLMTNSDQTARAIILREDPNLVREGAAFKETFSAAAGLAMPFVAAYLVSLLVSVFGDPAGYAAAYGLYAAALLIAIPIFQLMVRDPRYHDPAVAQKPSRNPLNILEPLWTAVTAPARAIARFLGLLLRRSARPIAGSAWARRFAIFLRHQGWPVAGLRLSRLLRWLRGLPASAEETAARATLLAAARARDVALETLGPVKAVRERLARFFDRRETTQGLAAILRSDTLSILMTVATIEMFLADAMMMVLMPNYIVDVLHPRPELASIPFIGQFLSTKAGIGGLMFGLANIGAFLAARWVSGPKGQERIARLGHPRLYHAAAVGSLLFWAMMIPIYLTPPGAAAALPLFFASLGVFLAMQFATTLLHRPLMISMAQVQRAQIPNDRAGRVIQALTMIEVGLMALGSLLVGLIVDGLGISTAVFILAFGVSGTAILQWLAPRWLGKIAPKGWEPGRKA
ncbi:MAG TPA: hypothetical protein VNI01_02150, partial [Elusimicrobiota bacterium]|nr:hypothetical protein [Elusimicrobiota bacterium]